MTNNDIINEINSGNTVRARRAVRNALRTKITNAIRAGFSADCDFDNLTYLRFTANAVLAGAAGFINCREHLFEVAIPFGDLPRN